MIRTQSRVRVRVWVRVRGRVRVRVRVRVIYLNQTGIRHQILGGVGVRVMHSRWDVPSSNPTHSILNCFFLSLKIEDTLTFMNISSRNFI